MAGLHASASEAKACPVEIGHVGAALFQWFQDSDPVKFSANPRSVVLPMLRGKLFGR